MEYTWEPGDDKGETAIPAEHRPQRLAITTAACVFHGAGLLVCNLHPDTYDNWLLPYAPVAIDLPTPADAGSLSELALLLDQSLQEQRDSVNDKISDAVVGVFGESVRLDLDPIFRSYALRFSQSAEIWTAYVFTYVKGILSEVVPSGHQITVIPLADEARSEVTKSGRWNGHDVAANVRDLLGSSDRLAQMADG